VRENAIYRVAGSDGFTLSKEKKKDMHLKEELWRKEFHLHELKKKLSRLGKEDW